MEMIELTDFDLDNQASTNFGGGIELLMNEKVREKSRPSSSIRLDDLNNLENELNELTDDVTNYGASTPKSDLFEIKPSVNFASQSSQGFASDNVWNLDGLGRATAETSSNEKTWDGYGKFNNIPLNPDNHVPIDQKLSKDELVREKFKYLRKLEMLEKKGAELTRKYTMDSPLEEMMAEYDSLVEEKKKDNSVKFQGQMLMSIISSIEYLNNRFDPFDVKLDGWSDQIQENINDYDDVFGELYEKYKDRGSISPELKLLFQLGGSGMMVHMTNSMFKTAIPGVDEVFRQHPDLMRSFQTATASTMSQSNPGLAGFMSGVMGGASTGMGPPPPVATQGPNAVPPPNYRPGNNEYARPDLNYGRSQNLGRSNFSEDGIHMREQTPAAGPRPEMKGPGDLSNILAGLKTKTINIQQPQQNNDSSTISFTDMKDIQADGNMPRRSGVRRKKSAMNTVNLDI